MGVPGEEAGVVVAVPVERVEPAVERGEPEQAALVEPVLGRVRLVQVAPVEAQGPGR
jgi:hypothetical protein